MKNNIKSRKNLDSMHAIFVFSLILLTTLDNSHT